VSSKTIKSVHISNLEREYDLAGILPTTYPISQVAIVSASVDV